MNKADVIQAVGAAKYHETCVRLRQAAADPNFGSNRTSSESDSDVPHEISDLIWDGDRPWQEKLRLLFEIYDEMPSYGHLMYVTGHYSDFSPQDKQAWWSLVRERVSSADAALRQPLAYSIWCDFFEHPDVVAEAWTELSADSVAETVLKVALEASGPVPYAMKRKVYDRLLPEPKWHPTIYKSLLFSAFDYYGNIEARDACKILANLRLPPDTEHLSELREKLGCAA